MNYDLGKFQMRLRGNYSTTTNYDFLDVVYYNGGSYCSKADGTKGKVPTNTTYWQQIAAQGQTTLTPEQKAEIVAALVEEHGIVIDPDYNQFTTEEKQKLEDLSNPNNATLTIQTNGRTVGTFTSNSAQDKIVNINVPTDYIPTSVVQTITEADIVIEKMQFGMVYIFTSPVSVAILSYEDEMEGVADYFGKYTDIPTYFYIRPQRALALEIPEQSLIVKNTPLTLDADVWYRVVCRAGIWEVDLLTTTEE